MSQAVAPRPVALAPAAALLALLTLMLAPGAARAHATVAAAAPAPRLVYHVETGAGEILRSRDADRALNPASLVKIATSLWALERLGPDHRFITTFSGTGPVVDGVLHGDLVVEGGGDPDFHAENVFMVAAALQRQGIAAVEGGLRLQGDFWQGWENGSARPRQAPGERARMMAERLRQALDPQLWNSDLHKAWNDHAARRGQLAKAPPRVKIGGGFQATAPAAAARPLVMHRSRPLLHILRRFNAWSNNDIERLEASLGGADALAEFVQHRLGLQPGSVRLSTLSGLGENRMTPRAVVQLLRELERHLTQRQLRPGDLLPVAGCGPGTLTAFERLASGSRAGAVTGKTGTLTVTDGGIVLLAGYAGTREGSHLFCLASPGSGQGVRAARRAQDRWLADLLDASGGAVPGSCPAAPGTSDDGAEVSAAAG